MKSVWTILIVGISIRLVLSYTTLHPDIVAIRLGGQEFSNGHIFNLYDYSSEANILNYPPLIYWFFGIFNLIFGGNIWLFKLPYLFFDLLLGYLLYKVVSPNKAILAFGLWMFNPINLYATYMIGQFDIIPTFFSFLSIYLALKGKLHWAALVLGGGIAFKLYPIFLVIPLVLLGKGVWLKIRLLVVAFLPYAISVVPYLPSASFRSNALFANQSSKSLYASILVSGGESIILFPAFLLLFYLMIQSIKLRVDTWKLYLIPLLLFFIFTHFHPQWLIWITPFIVLDLVVERFKNIIPILLILGSWIGSLFFFDPSLTIGLFNPLFPVLKNTTDIWTLLNLNMDYSLSRSILQTIFAASTAYLIINYIIRRNA